MKRLVLATSVVCVVQAQGCGDDDVAAPSPDASTPDDASTALDAGADADANADSGASPTTAGTCGATKASVRFGTDADDTIDSTDDVGGLAVFGTDLLFAGWRREAIDGGSPTTRLHFGRLDAMRSPVWTKTFGAGARGRAMSVDADGGMIVVGSFVGAINLGGADLASTNPLTSDAFVARFDKSDGAHRFSVRIGPGNGDAATAVAVDNAGDVWASGNSGYVTHLGLDGNVIGAFAIDPSPRAIAIAVGGDLVVGGDAFLSKVSTTGEVRWTKKDVTVHAIAIDAAGDVYVAGNVHDATTLDDAVVVRFDANGNEKWRKRWSGDANDVAAAIAIGPDGSVLVGGSTDSIGAIDFGGGKLGGGLTGAAFVVELAGDGTHRCSRAWKGDVPAATAIAYTGTTSFVAAGAFRSTLDVGKGPMTSAGGTDVWIADFSR